MHHSYHLLKRLHSVPKDFDDHFPSIIKSHTNDDKYAEEERETATQLPELPQINKLLKQTRNATEYHSSNTLQ